MEGKPQFIPKRVKETVLQIKSRIMCPAAEEPAKPHPPESNKNYKSKQELHESWAKIFK